MNKKTKNSLIIIFLLLVGGGGGYLALHKKALPVNLVFEKPVYGKINQSVTATGTIQPLDTVSVGTQVSGTIRVLNADFNSKVKKGQLLAQLDKSLLQAVVDQNQANLQTENSQLEFNKSNFNRQKLLYGTGSISRLDYETALNNYNGAVAGVASANAQLRSSRKNLSYADIYSPIDGVVLSRSISLGQTVAASFSTPTLFVIARDITKMQVQAAIDEADIGNVVKGNRAVFTVDAYIDDSFNGTVSEVRLHPKVASNVVTYTTIINAPNADMKLKPGMTANITVFTREVDHALLINSKALNFVPDSTLARQYVFSTVAETLPVQLVASGTAAASGSAATLTTAAGSAPARLKTGFVWLRQGNKLTRQKVTIGLDDNAHAEILSGLTPADSLVTSYPVAGLAPTSSSILPGPPDSKKKK